MDECYECSAYGDDYFINDDGELECACNTCYVMTKLLENNYDDDD
jgi:hypothetical protein